MSNSDISERLEMLIDLHQRLDNEADALSSRKYLFPEEKNRLKLLKVNRLKARDAIDRLKRGELE